MSKHINKCVFCAATVCILNSQNIEISDEHYALVSLTVEHHQSTIQFIPAAIENKFVDKIHLAHLSVASVGAILMVASVVDSS